MPSATRNTNDSSGSDGSTPGKPKTFWKKNDADAERGGEREDHASRQHRGASSARSSSARIRNTTTSAIGMITRLSRAADVRAVVVLRGRAADQHVLAARLLRHLAELRDLVERLGRVGVGLELAATSWRRAGLPAARPTPRDRRVGLERARVTASTCAGSGTITVVGTFAPAGKGRASRSWPFDGLDLAAERVAVRQAGVELHEAGAADQQHGDRAVATAPGALGDALADAAPGAVSRRSCE